MAIDFSFFLLFFFLILLYFLCSSFFVIVSCITKRKPFQKPLQKRQNPFAAVRIWILNRLYFPIILNAFSFSFLCYCSFTVDSLGFGYFWAADVQSFFFNTERLPAALEAGGGRRGGGRIFLCVEKWAEVEFNSIFYSFYTQTHTNAHTKTKEIDVSKFFSSCGASLFIFIDGFLRGKGERKGSTSTFCAPFLNNNRQHFFLFSSSCVRRSFNSFHYFFPLFFPQVSSSSFLCTYLYSTKRKEFLYIQQIGV